MIYQKVKADGKACSFILKSVNGYFHRFTAQKKKHLNLWTDSCIFFITTPLLLEPSAVFRFDLKYLIEYPFWEFKYHTRISEKWEKKK